MRSKLSIGVLLCPALLAALPAAGQAMWLEPDPIAPDPEQPVKIRLIRGDRFAGEESALAVDNVVAFQRLRKNGRENLPRKEGAMPVAGYTAGDHGVEIVALTWQAGAGSYYCKTVQVVGDAEAGHPLRYSELGQRLEIVPQTDPVLLARDGGKLEVQVLFEREPLAGVNLLAMPKRDPMESIVTGVTDEIGVGSLDLPRGGLWLIQVNYKTRKKERFRSTLVLQAGQP